jgi:hypothetical protein
MAREDLPAGPAQPELVLLEASLHGVVVTELLPAKSGRIAVTCRLLLWRTHMVLRKRR